MLEIEIVILKWNLIFLQNLIKNKKIDWMIWMACQLVLGYLILRG